MFLLHLPSKSLSSEERWSELAEKSWYKRYSAYPEYCSTPDQLQQRRIPPLQQRDIATSLLHVTSIIRHGARTPWDGHICWDGFWDSNETGIWDCELTTLTAPPAQPEVLSLEDHPSSSYELDVDLDEAAKNSMFLFEKRYDALHNPPQLRNVLNGTCEVGQLLLRGYAQELANGQMLRSTYIKDSTSKDTIQDNMILFDLTSNDYTDGTKRPYEEPNLYYRADDDQRTIMSGQVLLRGLFGDLLLQHSKDLGSLSDPIVVVHTGDRKQDILAPNPNVCPRLNDLADDATNSDEYAELYIKSEDSQLLNELMEEELGADFRYAAQDCLMTTICTDRKLPTILDDYGKTSTDDKNGNANEFSRSKYGKNIFERLTKFVRTRESRLFSSLGEVARYCTHRPTHHSPLIFTLLSVSHLSHSILY